MAEDIAGIELSAVESRQLHRLHGNGGAMTPKLAFQPFAGTAMRLGVRHPRAELSLGSDV